LRVASLLYAKTTPILRFAQEQALRVKPMLERRSRAGRILKRLD